MKGFEYLQVLSQSMAHPGRKRMQIPRLGASRAWDVLSRAKGFGKGRSFWMVKAQSESKWVWLGGKSSKMQWSRAGSLPLLLLLLAVLPVSSSAKTAP